MVLQSPLYFSCLTVLCFLLSASLIAAGADAPAQDAAGLSLNGTAFQDANGDGFFSPGEVGLANCTIRLFQEGNAYSNTTTNASGQYSFANLSPGMYVLIADPFYGWNQTAPGAGRYEVTLSDKSGFGLDYGFFAPQDRASLPVRVYPLMHPTKEEAGNWFGQYNASAKVYLSPEIAAEMTAAPVTSFSLLDRLKYTPSERDQGGCGNCWAWAGTGVMELDYARQKGESNRLSLQYLDSNYNGGCGGSGACCGGWLSGFASFYMARGMMVPWSNANAFYRDASTGCGACSPVSASSISTNPHYDLTAIIVNTIPSHGLAKEAAITNIKNVLLQGKGIWFAFYLPDGSAWSDFFSFWGAQPESVVWQPDKANGRSFDYQNGGGHAVLCVGYDDTDPKNRYWIMLNSWGDTSGRPAGLFRVNMDMNYDCSYPDLGYAFYWMTLDMSYPQGENSAPKTPSLPQGPVQGAVPNSLRYTTSTVDPNGDPVTFSFNWGDGVTSQTALISSGQGQASHAWSRAGAYQVTAKATDSNGASSQWSEALLVTIASANRLPSKPARPQGTAAGILQKSYGYTASASDPDGDDVQITFDWGDESTSVTDFVKSAAKTSASHVWQSSGTYSVRAKSTDSKGGQSAWSTYLTVKITANSPPKKPSAISGVASGYVGTSYSFTGYTTDPNQDQLVYTFDWGDGSTSKTNLVNSGTTVRMPHAWSSAGTYSVRVMATDGNDAVSPWSATKTVKVSDASRRSKARPSSAAKEEETGQGKKTCPCSQKS
jgi:hypothetical protein